MSRKRPILKRTMALMFALITVFVIVGNNISNTAFAANMSTGTHVFQDPGIDVFDDGRQATYTVKFADGKNAYCVAYNVDINDFNSYYPTDNPYIGLGSQQKTQISYALAYGYSPSSPILNSSTDISKYVMTQTLIWCITEKYWGNEAMMNKVRDRMAAAVSHAYTDVSIRYSQDYFNQLRSDMVLAMKQTIPSVLAINEQNAPTIILNWNSVNNCYETTITDSNGVLGSFDFSELSSVGISYSISGNNITFYTNKAINGTSSTITVNPKDGSYAAKNCAMSVLYWENGTKDQPVVSIVGRNPDPIKAYAKFATETSTLRLHKISSDNGAGINNVTFDIYADAECTRLVKSVVTQIIDGENGMADITGLGVGLTYFVKERAGAGAINHRNLAGAVAVTIKSGTNTIEISNDRVPVTVNLIKTDEKIGKGVFGAVYSLYAREDIKAAAGDTVIYTAGSWVADFPETDENGMAVLSDLYIGKYYVKEKSAPASGIYQLDTTEYEVDASASSKDFASDALISVNVNVSEPRNPGCLKLIKTSSTTGESLSGAIFGIYTDRECKNLIQTLITDDLGTAISKAFDEGTYYIKEIKAPAGYVTDTTIYSGKISAAKTTVIEIRNTPIKLTISKTSVTGDCPEIPGAELVIKDSEGNEIERWVSVTKPHIIEALPAGLYTLTELRTPFGYQVAETVSFTVLDTGKIQTLKMADAETYGKVIINKTDEKTKEPLEGVTFEVRVAADVLDADGNVAIKAGTVADTLVTDENGYAESEELPIGTYGTEGFTSYISYEMQETAALDGYVLDDTIHEIQFDYIDDKTPVIQRTFDFTNDFTKVEISKKSVTGDCPEIPGAELVIRDSEGSEIERWISTTEPHIIERLPAGTYTLTEVRTPFGYQMAETIEFTVEATGEIQTVEMADAETYGKVIINKADGKTGKLLKGVTFEIRVAEDVVDASGNIVIKAGTVADTLVTDEKGKAESELLPIGTYGAGGWTSSIKYELQETDSLSGYIIDNTVYEVRFDYADDRTPVIVKEYNITNDLKETEPEATVTATQDTPVPNTGDSSTGAVWWFTILLFSVLIFFLIINLKVKDN